jgi:hypothetical protein
MRLSSPYERTPLSRDWDRRLGHAPSFAHGAHRIRRLMAMGTTLDGILSLIGITYFLVWDFLSELKRRFLEIAMVETGLSAEVKKQIAAIDFMTLAEVRAMLTKCMADIIEGRVTPKEGSALNRAASKRVRTLKNA